MFAPTVTFLSVLVLLFVTLGQFATVPEEHNTKDNMINENPLTSHILDTSRGRPADNVLVKLYKKGEDGNWIFVSEQLTNQDGRIGNIISGEEFAPATYKLYFDTKSYFIGKGEKTFYPFIEVVFEIEKPEEHYHVPILLNAYGYSTYRGS